MLSKNRIRTLLPAAIAAAAFAVAQPAKIHAADSDVLTAISAVRSLSQTSAEQGQKVRLKGRVTYADPIWHFVFLQNGDDAVFIHGVDRRDVTAGSVIEVTGTTRFEFTPFVQAEHIDVVDSDSRLPHVKPVSNLNNSELSRFVELELAVSQINRLQDAIVLIGRSGDETVWINISRNNIDNPWKLRRLIGRTIRARGALGLKILAPAFYAPGDAQTPRQLGWQLFVTNMNQVDLPQPEKQSRPPNASRVPLSVVKTAEDTQHFRVDAQTAWFDEKSIVLQAGEDSIYASAILSDEIQIGQTAEVWLQTHIGRPPSVTMLRPLFILPLPEGKDIERGQTPEPWERIAITGDVSDLNRYETGYKFQLRGEGHVLNVDVPQDHLLDSIDLDTAKSVRVRGIVLPPNLTDVENIITVSVRAADVEVTRRETRFSAMFVLASFGFAGVTGLLVMGWIRSLRFLVAEKTNCLSNAIAHIKTSWEALDDGIITVDENNKLVLANGSIQRIFGIECQPGDDFTAFLSILSRCANHAPRLGRCLSDIRRKPIMTDHFELDIVAGTEKKLLVTTAPIRNPDEERIRGRLWLFHDQTDKKHLQSQLLHAQKMEALGTLAGGIAHNFNNLLAVVTMNLAVIEQLVKDPDPSVGSAMDETEQAVLRAANVVRQLLTFSRKHTLQFENVAVNELILESQSLFRHVFDATIRFEFDLADDSPTVSADRNMLEQVLLNLCVNARDAMPQGGDITIRTRRATSEQDESPIVLIEVEDTGTGMTAEVRDRIFEPFFTTKPANSGTGLGLAMSYGIIQQHNGQLHCESTVGKGTTFRITMPAVNSAQVAVEDPVIEPPEVEGLRVLLVDDEPQIRLATGRLLERMGMQVQTADAGAHALETLQKDSAFDVVLLDLTMPDMIGWEVLERIRDQFPGLPVVLCSGYVTDSIVTPDGNSQPDDYIAKPFRATTLVKTLHEAANRPGTAAETIA